MTFDDSEDKTKEEVIADESAENEKLPDATLDLEESKKWRTPGLQRMRIDWRGEDRPVWDRVKAVVETRLQTEFEDAYRLIIEIFDKVREADVSEHGEIVYKRDANGRFIENWDFIRPKDKENYMFELTTKLFFWQQQSADAWGEAMFAKAAWEERFAMGYDAPKSGTIEGRTARGRMDAREERYFAVFLAYYSKKADSLIRSMELLSQRLKDSMTN